MKRCFLLSGAAIVLLSSAACVPATPPADNESSSSSHSSFEKAGIPVNYEGTLQKLGVSIYMEGTHRLFTDETATPILLRSAALRLDDYVDERVRITGQARPAVEGDAVIVDVVKIDLLEDLAPMVLGETGASTAAVSSSAPASSSSVAQTSSADKSSSAAPLSSSTAAKASSSAAAKSSSSDASLAPRSTAASSEVGSASSVNRSSLAAATGKADTGSFTQSYCSSHIGFCVPLHKNWYYQSFGANVSPSLWHIEAGAGPIENTGDGVIMVNLVSGPVPGAQEGVAIDQADGTVVAYRQWTGNRHFAISGPKETKAAIEHMTQNLSVYQATE